MESGAARIGKKLLRTDEPRENSNPSDAPEPVALLSFRRRATEGFP